jgi:hypothetical protein
MDETPPCKTDPRAPHGFDRNASHSADRYVCECEGWNPPEGEEPVAWVECAVLPWLSAQTKDVYAVTHLYRFPNETYDTPIYAAPPKKEWVGLTKEEFEQAVDGLEDLEDCWVQIEDKLKEKNT